LPKAATLSLAADVFFRHVRRVIPAAAVVLYVPAGNNELAATYCAGSGASTIESTKIPVGERISGWAFAHRQMVFNSDASLDLGPVSRTLPVPLRAALVAPVFDEDRVVGVVALYGSEDFHKDHLRMLESATQLLSSVTSDLASAVHGSANSVDSPQEQKIH
jgi:GAF domain-containing protein